MHIKIRKNATVNSLKVTRAHLINAKNDNIARGVALHLFLPSPLLTRGYFSYLKNKRSQLWNTSYTPGVYPRGLPRGLVLLKLKVTRWSRMTSRNDVTSWVYKCCRYLTAATAWPTSWNTSNTARFYPGVYCDWSWRSQGEAVWQAEMMWLVECTSVVDTWRRRRRDRPRETRHWWTASVSNRQSDSSGDSLQASTTANLSA